MGDILKFIKQSEKTLIYGIVSIVSSWIPIPILSPILDTCLYVRIHASMLGYVFLRYLFYFLLQPTYLGKPSIEQSKLGKVQTGMAGM